MNDSIVGSIGRLDWMEPAEERLQKVIHKAFEFSGGRHVKNFLHGTWVGEPLPVILTAPPIGAWTTAIVFDALDSMSTRHQCRIAADTAVAVGLAGAAGAAATGLTDWQDIDPPARRIALVHGLLNVNGAVLFGASLAARRRRARRAGRSLARLGGNLVYEQKIGVDHTASEKLPEEFTSVLPKTNLPDEKPVRAEHNGTPVLLVRRGSRIYALAETCSHLGGQLSEGKLRGGIIQCPWHGSRFSICDGHVVDGPAVHPQPCLETPNSECRIEVRKSNREVTRSVNRRTIKIKSRTEREQRD